MWKTIIEVFMNDFSVYGNSFDTCLDNLRLILLRCIETNLVLNWKKCHFIVEHRIILGHIVSSKGIEIDRAKINIISSFTLPRECVGCALFSWTCRFLLKVYQAFFKNWRPIILAFTKRCSLRVR